MKNSNSGRKSVCLKRIVKNTVAAGIAVYFIVLGIFILVFRRDTNWLPFLGAYIGSFIGAAAIFTAFYFLFITNERQHRDVLENIGEQNRILILPLLTVIEFLDMPNDSARKVSLNNLKFLKLDLSEMEKRQTQEKDIWIKNIGRAAAVNVRISYPGEPNGVELGHLNSNDIVKLSFFVPRTDKEYNCEFSLLYSDLSGLEYTQKTTMQCTYDEELNVMRSEFLPSTYPVPAEPHAL